jgi:hypothetical protein
VGELRRKSSLQPLSYLLLPKLRRSNLRPGNSRSRLDELSYWNLLPERLHLAKLSKRLKILIWRLRVWNLKLANFNPKLKQSLLLKLRLRWKPNRRN